MGVFTKYKMQPVWVLLCLAVSSYSTGDSDNVGGDTEKVSVKPGHVDCRQLGTKLSRLSAQDDLTRGLLAGEFLDIFPI